MTSSDTTSNVGGVMDAYEVPGRGVHPEGLAYDERSGLLYTTSMLTGAVFRTSLDRRSFDVMSPSGANGCRSSTGLAVDVERRRLVVCGGVSGRVHLFDAETGAPTGYAANGLVDDLPEAMGPSATAPSFVNDIAFAGGDAYITDSYHPALFRLGRDVIRDGCGPGTARLERWLDFEGTAIRYRDGDTVPARFNLNGIVATPDERFLLVIQTNTGQLFRIEVATREVVEVEGRGNPGGDGLMRLGAGDLLAVDMTRSPTLTRLRLSHEWTRYQVVSRRDAPGNVSPTSSVVVGDRLLLTESQISDVLVAGAPEHLPYRVTSHSLSLIDEA